MNLSREGHCDFQGCGRKILARRLCSGHYQQQWEGRELSPLKIFPPLEERFWANISGMSEDGCWEWRGLLEPSGYGVIKSSGRALKAHRLSYELNVGEIPPGHEIDHQCRVRSCVNPNHLKPVTRAENRQNLVAYKNNSTGVRGVTQRRGRFYVNAHLNKKRHYGGVYDTLEQAESAAIALRNWLFSNNVRDWTTNE